MGDIIAGVDDAPFDPRLIRSDRQLEDRQSTLSLVILVLMLIAMIIEALVGHTATRKEPLVAKRQYQRLECERC